jgi:flavin-dependent dehydrogenase
MTACENTPDDRIDVLVVGAGPAGAVSALLLARAGLSVRLVERKRFPRRKVCGACLSESAVKSLTDIGLADVLRDAVPLKSFCLASRRRSAAISLRGGCVLSREVLDARIVAAAVTAGAGFENGVIADVEASDGSARRIGLRSTTGDSAQRTLRAKIVVFAAGLAGSAFRDDPMLRSHPVPTAHLGAGAEWNEPLAFYVPGTIYMATHRSGYVGLTRTPSGALNVAAAMKPRFVNERGGLGPAIAVIVEDAGFPTGDLASLDWTGTPPLTRSPAAVAADRLFLVGDAAGYVEPFTGEGIGWAIGAARNLTPIVCDAVRNWSGTHAAAWADFHRKSLRSRQRVCRTLARGLRSEVLVSAAIRLLQPFPQAALPVLRHLAAP